MNYLNMFVRAEVMGNAEKGFSHHFRHHTKIPVPWTKREKARDDFRCITSRVFERIEYEQPVCLALRAVKIKLNVVLHSCIFFDPGRSAELWKT